MNRFAFTLLPFAIAACAGVAFAVPHVGERPATPPAAASPSPTPDTTPSVQVAQPTTAPSNGHHAASGPVPVTEHHVIHATGPVAVTSGTVTTGTAVHGAVGTPQPQAQP